MIEGKQFFSGRLRWLSVGLALLSLCSIQAAEKAGMPDLCQVEQTCLPTSTANLIIWLGNHGYPKLILSGESNDERYLHTVHQLMADTDARFDLGTRPDSITTGIEKYIKDAGYDCTVEYRGLEAKTAFAPEWLQENNDPNKGFILLLTYCAYHPENNSFTNAWNAGHAVTLVNAEPDMLLIHDPAHEEDETGRKIITPQVITQATWNEPNGSIPIAGLMLLRGSLLEGPPNSEVMLTGAVCVTMHPDLPRSPDAPPQKAGPNEKIASTGGSGGAVVPGATSAKGDADPGWTTWVFDYLFGK